LSVNNEPEFTFLLKVKVKPSQGTYVDFNWVEPEIVESINDRIYWSYGEPFDSDLEVIEIKKVE